MLKISLWRCFLTARLLAMKKARAAELWEKCLQILPKKMVLRKFFEFGFQKYSQTMIPFEKKCQKEGVRSTCHISKHISSGAIATNLSFANFTDSKFLPNMMILLTESITRKMMAVYQNGLQIKTWKANPKIMTS